MSGIYGLAIPASKFTPLRSVIGRVETSPGGNLMLRVGRESAPRGGWSQTQHVVMTPDEARAFADEILDALAS